ncbi:MAG: CidA/LrgA family protein [Acidobacteria bacterium]|nr:CidA/LrgA family protein [Acidobacteriota bacterium]
MPILQSFFVLLLFQLAGEAISRAARIPIPGPVLGMGLLAVFYIVRKKEPGQGMQKTANGLLSWLGLLFVPAGTGVVANMALLRAAWLPVSVALIVSTLLTMAVTAWIMQRFSRRAA